MAILNDNKSESFRISKIKGLKNKNKGKQEKERYFVS